MQSMTPYSMTNFGTQGRQSRWLLIGHETMPGGGHTTILHGKDIQIDPRTGRFVINTTIKEQLMARLPGLNWFVPIVGIGQLSDYSHERAMENNAFKYELDLQLANMQHLFRMQELAERQRSEQRHEPPPSTSGNRYSGSYGGYSPSPGGSYSGGGVPRYDPAPGGGSKAAKPATNATRADPGSKPFMGVGLSEAEIAKYKATLEQQPAQDATADPTPEAQAAAAEDAATAARVTAEQQEAPIPASDGSVPIPQDGPATNDAWGDAVSKLDPSVTTTTGDPTNQPVDIGAA